MSTAILLPVFTSQPRALAEVLDKEDLQSHIREPKRSQLVTLLKTVLPDVLTARSRVLRGSWKLRRCLAFRAKT